jgi:hypothetical protein
MRKSILEFWNALQGKDATFHRIACYGVLIMCLNCLMFPICPAPLFSLFALIGFVMFLVGMGISLYKIIKA